MTQQEQAEAKLRRVHDFKVMGGRFAIVCVIALIAVAMASHTIIAAGLAYTIFLASILGGGFFGFIFSVPHSNKLTKIVEPDDPRAALNARSNEPVLVQSQPLLRSNSSLETISEWLTKMLVGIGLSQVNSIFSGLQAFGEFLKPLDAMKLSGAGTAAGNLQYAGPAVLVAGLCLGFLSAYLYIRLRITYLFVDAEKELKSSAENAPLSAKQSQDLTSIVKTSSLKESVSRNAMESANTASVRDALAVMTQLLYDVKDHGYKQVIEMGEKLVSTPAVSVARFWFLMAAAQGQRYAVEKKNGAAVEILGAIRSEVLYAIDKTLALNPKYKRMLLNMLDETNLDNDLKSFANDPEFITRLR
ncbi:MAG: rane protein of unknown function [Rhizobium sp.]|nr:rane protein of unknown function [Rhizobium sp.]